MNLFNLSASLVLKKEDYEKGLKDAKEEAKDFSEKTKKQIGVIAAEAWANLASMVINAGKAIIQATLNTIDYADQIGDLAGKWGFTTKEIQEFDYWATMNGTTLESLLTGMRGLVNQAEAGAPAFDKLGLSVRNADGSFKSQRTLFLETLDALKKVQNQTERNALQFEIFGRAGIELGQVIGLDSSELKALSQEAEDLGIILSTQTIDAAGAFNDELDKLKLRGKTAFAELIAGADGAEQKMNTFIDDMAVILEDLIPVFANIGIKSAGAFIKGLAKGLDGKIWSQVKFIFGEGWLWGEKTIDDAGDWFGKALFMNEEFFKKDGISQFASSSAESSQSTTTDNSRTDITVNLNGTGNTEQDARAIAQKVIEAIATQKQARGK